MEAQMEGRIGRLGADVQHIQADVSDIRSELRGTNQRIDALRAEMTATVEALRSEMNRRFEDMRNEMIELRDAIASTRIWTISLYVGSNAALLLVMAHGFNWL